MNNVGYPVPGNWQVAETEVRKSRFIAWAFPAQSREAVMDQLSRAKAEYPDARHHCWAYLLGKPGAATNAAMNDDGEPSGTAGKPILNVIEHKGIGDVGVIVIRYFGGIKLGAGGLVRAYAGAAEAVLSRLPLSEAEPRSEILLRADFPQEQPLRHWLSQNDGDVVSVEYGEGVAIRANVAEATLEGLDAECGALGVQLIRL